MHARWQQAIRKMPPYVRSLNRTAIRTIRTMTELATLRSRNARSEKGDDKRAIDSALKELVKDR